MVEDLCRTHHNKNLALLNFWKYIFIPGRPWASEFCFSICVSLIKNPGGVTAEHHTLEAVSKSQPLKHNGERALTPAIHCQIRPAVTVLFNNLYMKVIFHWNCLYEIDLYESWSKDVRLCASLRSLGALDACAIEGEMPSLTGFIGCTEKYHICSLDIMCFVEHKDDWLTLYRESLILGWFVSDNARSKNRAKSYVDMTNCRRPGRHRHAMYSYCTFRTFARSFIISSLINKIKFHFSKNNSFLCFCAFVIGSCHINKLIVETHSRQLGLNRQQIC